MEHEAVVHLLRDAVVVFASAVVVVLICHRVRVSPLVGLLVTGILIGPTGLELVPDREGVELFAEIGVVLLLFAIGLEVSLERLRELFRPFAIGGGVQVLATIVLASSAALAFDLPASRAVFFGFVVSLSSTAIVLKLYDARREMRTPQAQVTLGILLFQDFAVVPMLVLTPLLAGAIAPRLSTVVVRAGGAILAMVAVFVAARRLVPRLLRFLVGTRIREASLLGALALCLGMAWLTHGLGLSLALGAFVAGLLVSESEYSHQVIADVAPLRDVFASLFFVSMGMLVDLDVAVRHGPGVLALAAAIVVAKSLVAGGAARLLGYPERTTLIVAIGLAQVGEFSFVLMRVGHEHGLLAGDRFQLVLAAAVVTMVVTPLLVEWAPALAERWSDRRLSGRARTSARAGSRGAGAP